MGYYFIMNVNCVEESRGAIRWVDEYEMQPDRVVFTREELFIPGLRTFGHQVMRSAWPALQPHYHEGAFEVVLVTSGDVRFYVGNTEFNPMVGEVHLVQPDVVHSTRNEPMTQGEIYWLQLEIGGEEPLFLTRQAGRTLIDRLRAAGNAVLRLDAAWQQQLVADAFDLAASGFFEERYRIAAYLALFLTLLAQPGSHCRPEPSPDIHRALAYVRAHVREDINLESLAEAADLSLSYFKEKFRREMLTTPRTYINQQKIELAKKLLLTSGSVTSVAEELSFDTPAYFSAVFRKFTAMAPSRYIRENIEREQAVNRR